MTPINEPLTNPPPAQTQTAGPLPQTQTAGPPPEKPQPQPESELQTQVNMLSTQMTTINTIAVESKMKVDSLFSEIEKLKEELKKAPEI